MTTKKINKLRIFQICLLILIFISFIPGVMNAGQILCDADESRVWGFTYSLFGVDWSLYMQNDSLISFGYSLLLAPICALLSKSGGVYKVAAFGNAVALCVSYAVSLYVTGKMFKKNNKWVLTIACATAVFCPGYAYVKLLAVPDMILLMLFWIILGVGVMLVEKPSFAKLLLFAVLLSVGVMMHALMICPLLAGIVFIVRLIKQKKITIREALSVGLIVVSIIGAVQFFESVWLNSITNSRDTQILTSFSTLLSGITVGWDQKGFFSSVQEIINKLYSFGAGTFLFGLLGLIFMGYDKRKDTVVEFIQITFILMAVSSGFYYSNGKVADAVINSRMLYVVGGPIVIYGICSVFEKRKKEQIFLGILLFLLITIGVANELDHYSAAGIEYFNTGVFGSLLENVTASLKHWAYFIAVFAVIINIAVTFSVYIKWKKNQRREISIYLGMMACLFVSIVSSCFLESSEIIAKNETLENDMMKIGSLVRDEAEESHVYYILTGKDVDKQIVKMQYIFGKKQLYVISNSEGGTEKSLEKERVEKYIEDQKEGNPVYLLASVDDSNFSEYERKFTSLDLTEAYGLFADRDSEKETGVLEEQKKRIYEIPTKGNNSESFCLAPGTYEFSVVLAKEDENSTGECFIDVISEEKTLTSIKVGYAEAESQKMKTIGFEVSSDKNYFDVTLKIRDNSDIKCDLEKVIYRKEELSYKIGLESQNSIDKICSIISQLENQEHKSRNVEVINDSDKNLEVNTSFLQEKLDDKMVSTVKLGEKANGDFLISSTDSRSFYDYLDEYTMLSFDSKYVLLGKNSEKEMFKNLAAMGVGVLSEGRKLKMDIFFKNQSEEIDYTVPISVMSGNYNYIFKISSSKVGMNTPIDQSKIILESGESVIGTYELDQVEFNEEGTAVIAIPLALKNNIKRLKFRVESSGEIEAVPMYLEMTSDKFQVGSDNQSGMDIITDMIKKIGVQSEVYYVTSEAIKRKGMFSIANLEESLKGYKILQASTAQARDLNSDCYLILEKFGVSNMNLVQNYTMIAQEGIYSLWVSNQGSLQRMVYEKGLSSITNGNKIPIEVLNGSYNGQDALGESEIVSLNKGTYELSLSIKTEKTEDINLAVIQIVEVKDKEKEIDTLIKEQIALGAMDSTALNDSEVRDQIAKSVETENVLVSKAINKKLFKEGNSAVLTLSLNIHEKAEKLKVRVLSYNDNQVNVQAEWIEKK